MGGAAVGASVREAHVVQLQGAVAVQHLPQRPVDGARVWDEDLCDVTLVLYTSESFIFFIALMQWPVDGARVWDMGTSFIF